MSQAHEWLQRILDPSWVEHDSGLSSTDPLAFDGYDPSRESVVVASGTSGGFAVEAIAFDFDAFGGSMGVVAGEKIARAFERAATRRAAVVALTASGGARMQEGMPALTQMAKVMTARVALRAAGLPLIVYLRNPTTGGVYASFGSSADLLWAEPSATIGFAGPRVAATVTGRSLPAGSHSAEFAARFGLIDATVESKDLSKQLLAALSALCGPDAPIAIPTPPEPRHAGTGDGVAWDQVLLARHHERPSGAGFARRVASGLVEIRGDREGFDDATVLCGFGRIAGHRCGIIALDRGRTMPSGFRKAQRLARIASSLRLPLITFIDTPGADPSSESEAMGIARAISDTFSTLLSHASPSIAVVTGEGGSGGALALATCDRLLICEHATFSVIAPEGAAAILKRSDVPEVASALRLTAHDLRDFGIADEVIAEPHPGAHTDPGSAADAIARSIGRALSSVTGAGWTPADRAARWRNCGNGYLRSD